MFTCRCAIYVFHAFAASVYLLSPCCGRAANYKEMVTFTFNRMGGVSQLYMKVKQKASHQCRLEFGYTLDIFASYSAMYSMTARGILKA